MFDFVFDFLKKFRSDDVELSLEDLVKGTIVTKQKDPFEGGYKEYSVLPIEFKKGQAIAVFSYKPYFFSREKRIEIPVGLKIRESGKKEYFLEIDKKGYFNNIGKQDNTTYLSLKQSGLKAKLIKDFEVEGKLIEQEDVFDVVYLDYSSAYQVPFALYILNNTKEACCPYIEEDGELDRYIILNYPIVQEIDEKYQKLKRKTRIKKVRITPERGIKGKLTEEDIKKLNEWANKNDF